MHYTQIFILLCSVVLCVLNIIILVKKDKETFMKSHRKKCLEKCDDEHLDCINQGGTLDVCANIGKKCGYGC